MTTKVPTTMASFDPDILFYHVELTLLINDRIWSPFPDYCYRIALYEDITYINLAYCDFYTLN